MIGKNGSEAWYVWCDSVDIDPYNGVDLGHDHKHTPEYNTWVIAGKVVDHTNIDIGAWF